MANNPVWKGDTPRIAWLNRLDTLIAEIHQEIRSMVTKDPSHIVQYTVVSAIMMRQLENLREEILCSHSDMTQWLPKNHKTSYDSDSDEEDNQQKVPMST